MGRTGIRASAIIIRDGKILLIKRQKAAHLYWVLPGGGVEDGESEEQAVIREVKEETNLDTVGVQLAFRQPNPPLSDRPQPYFYCQVEGDDVRMIGEEVEDNSPFNSYELQWVDIKSISQIPLVPESAKNELVKLI